jgi:hypothetical protein
VAVDANFIATTAHSYIGATTGSITITLSAGVPNQKLIVKDEFGSSSTATGNITIQTTGVEKIDGATSYTIATDYGFVWLYFNNNWHIIGEKV